MNIQFCLKNEHSHDNVKLLYGLRLVKFFLALNSLDVVLALETFENIHCGLTNLTGTEGTITSPHYPNTTSNDTICEWKIFSSENSLISLTLVDLDLEEHVPCFKAPCCSNQWLSIPKGESTDKSEVLCGSLANTTIILSQPVLTIKYFSSSSNRKKHKRGFKIIYKIKKRHCKALELKCLNGWCIPRSSICNGIKDCKDGSDELNCSYFSNYDFAPRKILDVNHNVYDGCVNGKRPCELSPEHCYSSQEICDDKFDCPNGEDEVGCSLDCPNQIACSSGGCYHPSQRCNFKRNCRDNSDETGCPPEPCMALQFTCLNGACIPGSAICDGDDDCGDFSDEENCARSSFVTAAILGLLSCVFLFCIGISCLYKVYATRLRASASFAHQLETEPTDDEFIYREPPPAYSVAVADSGMITYSSAPEFVERCFESDSHVIPSRSSQNSRRWHRPCSGLDQISSARSCPRPNTPVGIRESADSLSHSDNLEQPKLLGYKPGPAGSRQNNDGVIELFGFQGGMNQCQISMSQGNYHSISSYSSPSLSPSRESATSSTSLEDQVDLVQSQQS